MQKSVQVRTPLYAAAYWQQAADEFKNIRVLAFAGMVTALAIILESFPIYLLGQSLNTFVVADTLAGYQRALAGLELPLDGGELFHLDLGEQVLG